MMLDIDFVSVQGGEAGAYGRYFIQVFLRQAIEITCQFI